MKPGKKTLSTLLVSMATVIATCLVIPFMVQSTEPTYMHMTDLQRGWNLVSMPRPGMIAKITMVIDYNDTLIPWKDAVADDLILTFVYGYDRDAEMYYDAGCFEGGEGYWMFSYVNCSLYYPQYNPPPPPS